ncbi:MAG: MBL fold metallo-hydrolase [Lachnospiraceae bacterium]|nr:MBL fold metallo-hydrolase [Lachnospiraceae bacterium]
MELYIAGGCSEHGRNCFLVKGSSVSFLVDAGLMKEKPEVPYPELTPAQVKSASYLFLTHSHTDHTGAIPWLYENGFSGRIIASEPTFSYLKNDYADQVTLASLGKPMTKMRLQSGLSFLYGRAGHSLGSVWYLFYVEGSRILFSGDYQEHSYAYNCDKIRGVSADAAVIDSAYGKEKITNKERRHVLEKGMKSLRHLRAPVLFPVPAHGRGLDLIRLLTEDGIPICLPEYMVTDFTKIPHADLWLKKGFQKAYRNMTMLPFEKGATLSDITGKEHGSIAILVRDSQLYDLENQILADDVIKAGGKVILTGKQNPQSYARELLDKEKAEFWRIPVHQTVREMKDIMDNNHFTYTLPYHCRETLEFKNRSIRVLKAGDMMKF